MNINLSKRGISILKDECSPSEILELRKELTVKPFINGDYGMAPKAFPVYCESVNKLYLPRFYGQKKYGLPTSNKLFNPKKINITFPKIFKR